MSSSCMPVNMAAGLASLSHLCRASLNTHLPKGSGQNLIRASILSKTVYWEKGKKNGFDFFNIYVVLCFYTLRYCVLIKNFINWLLS